MKGRSKNSKVFILTIAIVIMLLLGSIYVIYQNTNEEKTPETPKQPPDEETKDNNVTITKKITFSVPNVKDKGPYFELIDEKATSFTLEEGQIRVPVYTVSCQIPMGVEIFNFSFTHSEIKTMSLNRRIKPMSYPINTLSINNFDTIFLKKTDAPRIYPEEIYESTTGGGLYNSSLTKFLNFHIYPQRYSRLEKKLYYIEEATITFSYENIEENKTKNTTYDYLIITPKEFERQLNRFVEHKEKMNYSPIIITLEDIYDDEYFKIRGRDDQEDIKKFIKKAIEKWNTKFVLLVGDHEKIPVRNVHIEIGPSSTFSFASISDLYYSDIYFPDGSFSSWDTNENDIFGECNWKNRTEEIDFYPDVYLGRIPCDTKEDVTRVVNKFIKYETLKNKKSWINNMILVGGDTFPPPKSLLSYSQFRILKMVEALIYEFDELVWEEGKHNCEVISKVMNDFEHTKIYTEVNIPKDNYYPLTNTYITDAVEKGAGILYFSGHGNPTTYATYKTPAIYRRRPAGNGFTIQTVKSLNNGKKQPVVIFDACSMGKFDEKDCISWDFINMENNGAIATYGCTDVSFGRLGSFNAEGLNGFMAIKLFENYAKGYHQPGVMMAQAQIDYQNQIAKLEDIDYLITSIWEFFGDPSILVE